MQDYDLIIIGAGAAGLMCAVEANKRGRRVLLLDQAAKVGQKIRISGGGRANFTNLHASPANFLSDNPRFCVSALKRYTQHDFIALVEKHGIVAAKGKAGTGLIFVDTLVHGSPPNLSPWDRAIFSLILNPVTNRQIKLQRPDHKHHRNFSPVQPLADDCLMDLFL